MSPASRLLLAQLVRRVAAAGTADLALVSLFAEHRQNEHAHALGTSVLMSSEALSRADQRTALTFFATGVLQHVRCPPLFAALGIAHCTTGVLTLSDAAAVGNLLACDRLADGVPPALALAFNDAVCSVLFSRSHARVGLRAVSRAPEDGAAAQRVQPRRPLFFNKRRGAVGSATPPEAVAPTSSDGSGAASSDTSDAALAIQALVDVASVLAAGRVLRVVGHGVPYERSMGFFARREIIDACDALRTALLATPPNGDSSAGTAAGGPTQKQCDDGVVSLLALLRDVSDAAQHGAADIGAARAILSVVSLLRSHLTAEQRTMLRALLRGEGGGSGSLPWGAAVGALGPLLAPPPLLDALTVDHRARWF